GRALRRDRAVPARQRTRAGRSPRGARAARGVTDLADVLWIGGGTGSGKSSMAIALAQTYGLERYNYDWHDARDHSDRTRPDRHPMRSAFLAMSLDDQWVNRTPGQMVEAELAEFAERFEMVLEDLAGLAAARVVVDGFGLLPD